MNGLALGDIVFDPRRVLFIKSLKAVVCADLRESTHTPVVVKTLIEAMNSYQAETLVILGCSLSQNIQDSLLPLMQAGARVLIVTNLPSDSVALSAETQGFEIHRELVWGKYRFVECLEHGAIELYFVSAIGSSGGDFSYSVRVGRSGLGGLQLPVFLKGLGQIMLPAINPESRKASVFRKSLSRYDVFAVGHHRVFPLGKVADLKEVRTLGQIPLAPSTLGNKRNLAREK